MDYNTPPNHCIVDSVYQTLLVCFYNQCSDQETTENAIRN